MYIFTYVCMYVYMHRENEYGNQARAIFEAAINVKQAGGDPQPDIMVPLAGTPETRTPKFESQDENPKPETRTKKLVA
jgi:hypothetical protein